MPPRASSHPSLPSSLQAWQPFPGDSASVSSSFVGNQPNHQNKTKPSAFLQNHGYVKTGLVCYVATFHSLRLNFLFLVWSQHCALFRFRPKNHLVGSQRWSDLTVKIGGCSHHKHSWKSPQLSLENIQF